MPFPSVDLCARVERAECALIAAGTRAIPAQRPGTDVFVREVAGGVACVSEPGCPMNKVAGLGFGGVPDERELEQIERAFAAREVPVQVELSSSGAIEVAALFSKRGYELRGFENVLGRSLKAEETWPEVEGVAIEPVGDEGFAQWLDVVISGFVAPDTQGVPSHESFPRELVARAISDLASAEGFRPYLARLRGVVAGGASLMEIGGVALLSGSATLPAHRRRGVQTALLRRRLRESAERGCDVAVVTTQPGSKSHENVHKQGFELLYARAVLVLGE